MSFLARNSKTLRLAAAVLVSVLLLIAPFYIDQGELRLIMEILLVFAVAQAWNLLGGYAGLMSFGHNVFVGLGAYTLFMVANHTGLHPIFGVVAAALFCGVFTLLIAPVLFRLNNIYFSIGMWVLADAVRVLVSQWDVLGYESGLILQLSPGVQNDWFIPMIYWIAVALAIGTLAAVMWMLRANFGLGLMAVRDNEEAAAAIGIDVWRSRLIAFVFSSIVCGAAGATYYSSIQFIDPNSAFDMEWVVRSLFIVVIGGIGSIEGPFIGMLVYFMLREVFADAGGWYLILMGLVAMAVMLFAPQGIWGLIHKRFGIEIFPIRRLPPK